MDTLPVKSPATPAQTGVWVGIAAISMSFAAYTSALVVRQGATADWLHFRLPPILFLNTGLVVASSLTLYAFRARATRAAVDGERPTGGNFPAAAPSLTWLYLTLGLGVLFLVGQVLAWRDLAAQGLTLATSPSSGFFFLLTAMHGLHLFGGLVALTYALYRLRRSAATAGGTLKAASLYWHFMTVLWLYLFAILASRI
jgi:cytochrome c oxidase subunit 3